MELQALIDRAGELHQRVADEAADSVSYCKLCCEQGRLCCVLETEYGERERLFGIKDSLKDVETMLLYIQSVQRWQTMSWNTAIGRLEESRSSLMEKTSQYRGREGRGVMEELERCFGRGKITAADPKVKKGNGRIGFLIRFVGRVFRPWKWHRVARLVLVSTAISAVISVMSRRRIIWDSRKGKELNGIVVMCSDNLDVLHGRG